VLEDQRIAAKSAKYTAFLTTDDADNTQWSGEQHWSATTYG